MSDFVKRDIVEVLEECGVDLIRCETPRGTYYKALCPFHEDHKPSFLVYENTQRCECRAKCAWSGDVIDFIMKFKRVDFLTAKKMSTFKQTASEAFVASLKSGKMFNPTTTDYRPVVRRLRSVLRKPGLSPSVKDRIAGQVLGKLQTSGIEDAETQLQSYEELI